MKKRRVLLLSSVRRLLAAFAAVAVTLGSASYARAQNQAEDSQNAYRDSVDMFMHEISDDGTGLADGVTPDFFALRGDLFAEKTPKGVVKAYVVPYLVRVEPADDVVLSATCLCRAPAQKGGKLDIETGGLTIQRGVEDQTAVNRFAFEPLKSSEQLKAGFKMTRIETTEIDKEGHETRNGFGEVIETRSNQVVDSGVFRVIDGSVQGAVAVESAVSKALHERLWDQELAARRICAEAFLRDIFPSLKAANARVPAPGN
jgi:hypothetical protein